MNQSPLTKHSTFHARIVAGTPDCIIIVERRGQPRQLTQKYSSYKNIPTEIKTIPQELDWKLNKLTKKKVGKVLFL